MKRRMGKRDKRERWKCKNQKEGLKKRQRRIEKLKDDDEEDKKRQSIDKDRGVVRSRKKDKKIRRNTIEVEKGK